MVDERRQAMIELRQKKKAERAAALIEEKRKQADRLGKLQRYFGSASAFARAADLNIQSFDCYLKGERLMNSTSVGQKAAEQLASALGKKVPHLQITAHWLLTGEQLPSATRNTPVLNSYEIAEERKSAESERPSSTSSSQAHIRAAIEALDEEIAKINERKRLLQKALKD
jgi:hypothetical protein